MAIAKECTVLRRLDSPLLYEVKISRRKVVTDGLGIVASGIGAVIAGSVALEHSQSEIKKIDYPISPAMRDKEDSITGLKRFSYTARGVISSGLGLTFFGLSKWRAERMKADLEETSSTVVFDASRVESPRPDQMN